MSIYSAFPFIRILLAFIPGLLLANIISIRSQYIIVALLVLLCIGILQLNYKKFYALGSNWKNGFSHLLFYFLCGLYFANYNFNEKSEFHFINQINFDDKFYCVVQVNGNCEQKEKSIKLPIKLVYIEKSGKWKKCFGNSIIYIKKDSLEKQKYLYGDILFVQIRFNPLLHTNNPGEFNYPEHLKLKGIFATGFCGVEPYYIGHEKSLRSLSQQTALALNNLIYNSCSDKKIAAFIVALLIGQKSELDDDLIEGFSVTGTLHVLSVSGLHTGLLFIAFQTLLQFLLGKEKRRGIFTLSLLSLLWAYAFITGLSPSVTRAVMMISLVIIGRYFNFKSNIYNSIAAAALILLCINPTNLYQLSFLLSFLAVTGIVYLQEKIYTLLFFENRIIDKIWLLCSVSLAAQLATLPICLYNFSGFPTYFLLANLLVIPLTTIILYLVLVFILLSFIPWLNDFLMLAIEKLSSILFFIIDLLAQLPFASYSISISFYECIFFYLSAILLFTYLQKRKIKWIYFTLISMCSALLIRLFLTVEINSKLELIYLSSRNTNVFYYYNQHQSYVLSDRLVDDRLKQSIRNYSIKCEREDAIYIINDSIHNKNLQADFCFENEFYQFRNKLIYIPRKGKKINYHSEKLKIDVLILTYHPYQKLEKLLSIVDIKIIVLSNQLSDWSIQDIKTKLEEKKCTYYNQKLKGAFKII